MEQANILINEWKIKNDTNEILDLSDLELTSLPELPLTLLKLNCNDNLLTGTFSIPSGLTLLMCSKNEIDKFEFSDDSELENLDCSNNLLSNKEEHHEEDGEIYAEIDFPLKLKILECSGNNIKFLHINKLVNLSYLNCENNPLEFINSDNPDLFYLNVNNCKLTELKLNDTLQELFCENNNISQLESLPRDLTILNCSNNNLTDLPQLSNNLEVLICNGNDLHFLPELPNSIEELDITNTYIYDIPNIPSHLKKLKIPNKILSQSKYDLLVQQNVVINNNVQYIIKPKPIFKSGSEDSVGIKCNNDTNLMLDQLSEFDVIIVNRNNDEKYVVYCYEREELDYALNKSDGIHMWTLSTHKPQWRGQANTNYNVYKEPYTGLWLHEDSLFYFHLFNCLVLVPLIDVRLGTGSEDWVSSMHGTDADIHTIYMLYPVNSVLVQNKNKITMNDVNRFIPQPIDINKNYTIKTIEENNIIAELIESDYKIEINIRWNSTARIDKKIELYKDNFNNEIVKIWRFT